MGSARLIYGMLVRWSVMSVGSGHACEIKKHDERDPNALFPIKISREKKTTDLENRDPIEKKNQNLPDVCGVAGHATIESKTSAKIGQ